MNDFVPFDISAYRIQIEGVFKCLLCRFTKFIVNGARLVAGNVANLWILFVAKQHPLLDIERRMMILKVLQSSRSAFGYFFKITRLLGSDRIICYRQNGSE